MGNFLGRQGYDDVTCGNGFTEELKDNYTYREGYRLGLENRLIWAEDDLKDFNELYPKKES